MCQDASETTQVPFVPNINRTTDPIDRFGRVYQCIT
jgi:hypothetical protein